MTHAGRAQRRRGRPDGAASPRPNGQGRIAAADGWGRIGAADGRGRIAGAGSGAASWLRGSSAAWAFCTTSARAICLREKLRRRPRRRSSSRRRLAAELTCARGRAGRRSSPCGARGALGAGVARRSRSAALGNIDGHSRIVAGARRGERPPRRTRDVGRRGAARCISCDPAAASHRSRSGPGFLTASARCSPARGCRDDVTNHERVD